MPPSSAYPGDEEIRAAVRSLQAGGDPGSFGPIFRRYFRPLRTFFANRPALRDEAEDLAQVTLAKVYKNIGQYRFDESFDAWVRAVAENEWKNAVRDRRAAKRLAVLESLDQPLAEGGEAILGSVAAIDREPTPEETVLSRERTRVLGEAIAALPAGMRQCIELRLLDDLKYREIAVALGIGLNSVRSQLFEARKRLQPVLDEYFQGADF